MGKRLPAKTRSYSVFPPQFSVTFVIGVPAEGLESVLGAAYLMMDRAYVAIAGDRKKELKITLKNRVLCSPAQLEALAREFLAELDTQKIRWAIARNNAAIRQYVAEQSVLLSNAGAPGVEK